MSLGEDGILGGEMGVLKKAWRSLRGRPGRLGELRRRDHAGTSAQGRDGMGWAEGQEAGLSPL